MDGEFNELSYNNTNITFSATTNNIATSDETSADPIYQRQMGTNYSKSKKAAKGVTIAVLAFSFTAIAVSTGSVLKNIFVWNPPTISNQSIVVQGETLTYSFTVKNKMNYKTTYYLEINGERVIDELCSESKDYSGEYSPVASGDRCKFFITFTNSIDYYKTIYTNDFVVK